MKLLSSPFFEHVLRFWRRYTDRRPSVVVAVSGGVDSRLLLEFAAWLRERGEISELRAMGVHHHTRPGQDQEMELMAKCAEFSGVKWKTLHRSPDALSANLEHQLRADRYSLLRSELKDQEELWLGHHLDDSWEWSMLQQSRSSEVRAGLGIPFKNGRLWRPFLCVTRSQIEAEARRRNLEWFEDPSNREERFARSLFRHHWHPKLKAAHPQFLKHYARRSQRLAELLGVALKKPQATVLRFQNSSAILLQSSEREDLLSAIKDLSGSDRGSLGRELEKILQMDWQKKGPHLLSGGVRLWRYGDWLLLSNSNFEVCDRELSEFLPARSWNKTDVMELIHRSLECGQLQHAPFWFAFDPEQKHRNVLVASGRDPLWPKLTSQRNVPVIHAQKLLSRWKDPELVLRLSPLWPLQPLSGAE